MEGSNHDPGPRRRGGRNLKPIERETVIDEAAAKALRWNFVYVLTFIACLSVPPGMANSSDKDVVLELPGELDLGDLDPTYLEMLDRMDGNAAANLRNNLCQHIHAQFLRSYQGDEIIPEAYQDMFEEVLDTAEDEEELEQGIDAFTEQVENQIHNAFRQFRHQDE